MPSNFHLVTRDNEQGSSTTPANWDHGVAAPEFPPGWEDYAAAPRRFLNARSPGGGEHRRR